MGEPSHPSRPFPFSRSPAALRGCFRLVVLPACAGAALAALLGTLCGIHNDWTPHVPRGLQGAMVGAALGATLGTLLGLLTATARRAAARALGGAAFGALVGVALGLRVGGLELSPGPAGALAGGALGGVCLAAGRFRALLLALACAWACGVADPASSGLPVETPRPLERVAGHDVTPRPIDALPPGAVLADGPPAGWSHLVLLAHYQVHSGDTDRFPRAAAEAVAALAVCYAANVEADGVAGRHRLTGLGAGVAARIGQQEVLVSGNTQDRLGAGLNLVARRTLEQHEKHLLRVRIKVRSDTFAVFDNPTHLLHDGRHHPVVLRYGLLVDPQTGRLATLVWRIDGSEEEGYRGAVGPAEWLPASLTHLYLLHADAREYTFGLPVREAILALPSLPPGRRQMDLEGLLRDLAGLPSFTPEQAAELERGLRETLARQK